MADVAFESDRELNITVELCDASSARFMFCLSIDGSTRIATPDAPNGKCIDYTLYAEAPRMTTARFSDKCKWQYHNHPV